MCWCRTAQHSLHVGVALVALPPSSFAPPGHPSRWQHVSCVLVLNRPALVQDSKQVSAAGKAKARLRACARARAPGACAMRVHVRACACACVGVCMCRCVPSVPALVALTSSASLHWPRTCCSSFAAPPPLSLAAHLMCVGVEPPSARAGQRTSLGGRKIKARWRACARAGTGCMCDACACAWMCVHVRACACACVMCRCVRV